MTEAAPANNHQPETSPLEVADLANAASDSGLVKFNDAPAADAQQDAELNEMRVISKRLKALDPSARARVLAWLSARFA